MTQKTIIIYDLKGKSNAEKTAIQRKLYSYRDKSNYKYNYQRQGELSKLDIEKNKKIVIYIKNKKDTAKITEILNETNIKFEIAKI